MSGSHPDEAGGVYRLALPEMGGGIAFEVVWWWGDGFWAIGKVGLLDPVDFVVNGDVL